MKYIVHKRFKDSAICGEINLPALTECECKDEIIYYQDKPLCFYKSENAHQHFAVNEDGFGMKRGALTQAIQKRLAPNSHLNNDKRQECWNKIWEDEISQKYRREDYEDYWLWGHDFFNANIDDLQHIAKLIGGITV